MKTIKVTNMSGEEIILPSETVGLRFILPNGNIITIPILTMDDDRLKIMVNGRYQYMMIAPENHDSVSVIPKDF